MNRDLQITTTFNKATGKLDCNFTPTPRENDQCCNVSDQAAPSSSKAATVSAHKSAATTTKKRHSNTSGKT